MKPASVALHVTTGIIVGLFASHFHWALGLAVTISYFIVLGECLYSEANATFTRFDDAPSLSVMSRGALTIETLRIGNIFAKIIKSHYVPTKNAPVVIMHHGYGSNYRRMLVYAYPVALAGYAVVLYNALGHGKIVREDGTRIDERSPGDKTDILEIARTVSKIVDFVKARDELDGKNIGFVGISLGAIVGLTHGVCHPDIKCVIALAGLHSFVKTATRKLVPFTPDWFMKKSFEWSGLEMKPTALQDRLVSPEFYIDKEFGFFEHPVWTEKNNAEKVFLIHAENDCTIPFWNFAENVKKLALLPHHFLALLKGNHWFIRQEHLVIGQILGWLRVRLH